MFSTKKGFSEISDRLKNCIKTCVTNIYAVCHNSCIKNLISKIFLCYFLLKQKFSKKKIVKFLQSRLVSDIVLSIFCTGVEINVLAFHIFSNKVDI